MWLFNKKALKNYQIVKGGTVIAWVQAEDLQTAHKDAVKQFGEGIKTRLNEDLPFK